MGDGIKEKHLTPISTSAQRSARKMTEKRKETKTDQIVGIIRSGSQYRQDPHV